MSKDLAAAYDKQTITDVFLRYTNNRRLIEILATYLGRDQSDRHLDVGFSGRLALFDSLTDDLTVLNLSKEQLEIGTRLLEATVKYFHAFRAGNADGQVAFLSSLPDTIRRDIVPIVDDQIAVIERAGKSPHVPSRLRMCNTVFEYKTDGLDDSSFETLSMIDVVVHVLDVSSVFAEVARVLSPGGTAVITYFTPGANGEHEASEGVDQIFARLCDQVSVPFDHVYDRGSHTVYPAKLNEYLTSHGRLPVTGPAAKDHWLDLPFFQLHSDEYVQSQVSESALKVEDLQMVPGGMFPARRRAIVLRK